MTHGTPQFPPGSRGWIKALALNFTGSPVVSMTAPGGPGRRSVRLELEDGRTVIATRRDTTARAENEAALLKVLSHAGAPVPHVVGFRDGLLLQEDAGRNRLSFAMTKAGPEGAVRLARSALAALEACREAMARHPALLSRLPGLGTRSGWSEEFVSRSIFLSGDLGIAPPDVDADALSEALQHPPDRFTRWDARAGNAAVQPDGSIIWFDWDLFGRRAGVEDVAWLVADDYWAPDASATEALIADLPGMSADRRALLARMAVLIAANRLKLVHSNLRSLGWADPDEALRLDKVSAVQPVVTRLCARMGALAAGDPLIAGYERWFADAGASLVGLERIAV